MVMSDVINMPIQGQQGEGGIFYDHNMRVTSRLNESEDGWFDYAPENDFHAARIASRFFPSSMGSLNGYKRETMKANALLQEALTGSRRGRANFLEALSYDDFDFIMKDTLYRGMLKGWSIPRSPYESFSKEVKVPTMQRPGKQFVLDGMETPIPITHPGQQPDLVYPRDSGRAIRPYKYMRDTEILWETMLEDDLNALGDLPNRLSNACQVSIARINTSAYADKGGWRDGTNQLFDVTNNDWTKNPTGAAATAAGIENKLKANTQFGIQANAPLTKMSLQAARTQMSKLLSPDGNPIDVSAVHLVVGPGLAEIAMDISQARSFTQERAGGLASGGGSGFVRMEVARNPLSGITLHVDQYLHVIVDNGSMEDTMWMLAAEPSISRPAFFHCRLAGWEKPILQRRIPSYRGMEGGSGVDWISSGFRTGFIYGVRTGDPRGVIASDGQ